MGLGPPYPPDRPLWLNHMFCFMNIPYQILPVKVSALQDEVKPLGTDRKLSSDSSELFLIAVLLRGVTGQTAVEARLANNFVTPALLLVGMATNFFSLPFVKYH